MPLSDPLLCSCLENSMGRKAWQAGRLQSVGSQSSTLLSMHECKHASGHFPEVSQVEWEEHGL